MIKNKQLKKIAIPLILASSMALSGCGINGHVYGYENGYGVPIFVGPPEFTKMHKQVVTEPILMGAPLSTASLFNYESFDLGTNTHYSDYQIRLVGFKGRLTKYKTIEFHNGTIVRPVTGAISTNGLGIGYGGILSLVSQKIRNFVDKRDYYKKYEVAALGPPTEPLFPLVVGKCITFPYTDLMQYTENDYARSATVNTGTMKYEVVAHYHNFAPLNRIVPGDVYVIRYSKNNQDDATFVTQVEYYYSTALGWYVIAKYYDKGKPVVAYRLREWR